MRAKEINMKDHYSLTLVSKKELVNIFGVNESEAKLVHKYRKSLPVITDFDGEEGFCVDMRELHKQLKVKTKYNDWIKKRLSKLELVDCSKKSSPENNSLGDYIRVVEITKFGQQGRVDFMLTVDSAKQVAMIENTEIGMMVRKYFILCEKIVLRMAKRNPIRGNCKEATKMMANNIAGRVPAGKLPTMMQDMNAFICTVATGARPSAWKQNIGVNNVRDFLKENSKVSELRRYDELVTMAEMLSRDFTQTRETIKEQLKRVFGESEIYFKYLHGAGVKPF